MFHLKDGWFFSRLSNGTVTIEKRKTAHETSELVSYAAITPEEWASVVASVSAGGESNDRWQQALDFHGQANNASSRHIPTPREYFKDGDLPKGVKKTR